MDLGAFVRSHIVAASSALALVACSGTPADQVHIGDDTSAPTTTVGNGIPCVAGGVVESEPNDDTAHANTLAPTVCGAINPGTESDFLRFTLSDASRSMSLSSQAPPAIPLVHGKPYFIEVRSLDQSVQDWRVTIVQS